MKNNKIIKWSGSKTYLSEEIDKFVTEAMLKGTLNNSHPSSERTLFLGI